MFRISSAVYKVAEVRFPLSYLISSRAKYCLIVFLKNNGLTLSIFILNRNIIGTCAPFVMYLFVKISCVIAVVSEVSVLVFFMKADFSSGGSLVARVVSSGRVIFGIIVLKAI